MDQQGQPAWRQELDRWLSGQRPAPPPLELPSGELFEKLWSILDHCRLATAGLAAVAPGLEMIDRNKYDFVASRLAEIVQHQGFSLAEYTYRLPDGRSPGVRVWLDERHWQRLVSLILFPDVTQWRVDHQGRKEQQELLALHLDQAEPAAVPPPALSQHFQVAWSWQECLTQALALPLLMAAPGSGQAQ